MIRRDTGGINDKSFNQSAWAGMQAAAAANPSIQVKYLQSTTQNDYVPNINTFLGEKCGVIVTVGFLMAAAIFRGQGEPDPGLRDRRLLVRLRLPDRHQGDQHRPADVQHRAGRLPRRLPGAGMSKTGKVATFGGQEFGTVTIYMDGYADGVAYYNQQHKTNVQVLGWNEQTQKGEFTGDFTNQTKGQTVTQTFISEGADVIFPVAGNVGLGAAKAVQQADASGGKVNMEWVDVDGCISAAQYCKYFITNDVTKGITVAVTNIGRRRRRPDPSRAAPTSARCKNDGAVLSPFPGFSSTVPASLQSELKTVEAGIESGSIQTPTKSPIQRGQKTWNLSSGHHQEVWPARGERRDPACRWPLARSTPSSRRERGEVGHADERPVRADPA